MRVGSLFAGYGGIDLGLAMVLDAEPAWFCEFDKHPSAILAHRFPGVVNLGDIATVDWAEVEPVDIITGGYPCQPFSHAGNRKGTNDERHLWPYVKTALRVLRPRLAVFENVAGHLSLGFDTVLADLAEIGWDAEWLVVRASDAGAPHRRERVFIVAAPHARSGQLAGAAVGIDRLPVAGECGHDAVIPFLRLLPTAINRPLLLPTPRATDGEKGGPNQTNGRGGRGSLPGVVPLLPTPTAGDSRNARNATAQRSPDSKHHTGTTLSDVAHDGRLLPTPTSRGWKDGAPNDNVPTNALLGRAVWHDFGPYAPAIARWEAVLGRPAPSPTEPNKDGRPRLSPRFVEFMMGLPDGWVADTGIPRNAQLKALGNGVVPQQLALALSILLPRLEQP